MVERVAVHSADEDILVAVVVIISDGYAHIETGAGQTGGVGYILKAPLPVIAEKAIEVFRRGLLQAADIRSIGEEDIGRAIIVVVEDCDASRHGLRRMALRGLATIEREVDRLISESYGARRGLRKHAPPSSGEKHSTAYQQARPSGSSHLSLDYMPRPVQCCSLIVTTRSAATSRRTVFSPEGQRTVIESARVALPSPKCSRISFCDR